MPKIKGSEGTAVVKRAEIVEKVNASVSIDLPMEGTARRPKPADRIPIKTMEDFLFNARMRGAGDDSEIIFTHDKHWNGYDHDNRLTSFRVNVGATLDGFPLIKDAAVEKKDNDPKILQYIFSSQNLAITTSCSFVIIFFLKLLGVA